MKLSTIKVCSDWLTWHLILLCQAYLVEIYYILKSDNIMWVKMEQNMKTCWTSFVRLPLCGSVSVCCPREDTYCFHGVFHTLLEAAGTPSARCSQAVHSEAHTHTHADMKVKSFTSVNKHTITNQNTHTHTFIPYKHIYFCPIIHIILDHSHDVGRLQSAIGSLLSLLIELTVAIAKTKDN